MTISTFVFGAWTGATDLGTFGGDLISDEWSGRRQLAFRKHPDFDNLVMGDFIDGPLELSADVEYLLDLTSNHQGNEIHILLHTTHKDRVLNVVPLSLKFSTDLTQDFSEHTLAMALLGPGEDVGCGDTPISTGTATSGFELDIYLRGCS